MEDSLVHPLPRPCGGSMPSSVAALRAALKSGHRHFPGLSLDDIDGVDIDLSGCNLEGGHFQQARFGKARFGNCTLTHCRFQQALIWGADLSNVDATGSWWQEADLSGSRLQGANFSEAMMPAAVFGEWWPPTAVGREPGLWRSTFAAAKINSQILVVRIFKLQTSALPSSRGPCCKGPTWQVVAFTGPISVAPTLQQPT